MNVFDLRNRLVADYASYVKSFIRIEDKRIEKSVDESLDAGLLWPEPLIQLNPSFELGDWIDDLVKQGVLHAECSKVFQKDKGGGQGLGTGTPLRLHKHQSDAIRTAQTGSNYVLTTGTGSGKSLTYIVPIVDHVLRRGSGKGVQAIVVYPMNALANSQYGELEKFLKNGYPDGNGPVTFERYTGQESDEDRQRVLADPPDIILTNYVMLELILTRPVEKPLIQAAQGLRFLVLDELHTYRGRQGADVALLVRRVRDRLAAEKLQCVGTSATLAGSGNYDEQRAEVAAVALQLFGDKVKPEHVIGESIRRATPSVALDDPTFVAALAARISDTTAKPPHDYKSFVSDPLSIWIESTYGVTEEPGTGRLIRATPRSLTGEGGAAVELSTLTGVPLDRCVKAIQQGLLAGYECEPDPETGFPAFAFRLHQFISRGDTVYASVEPEEERYITGYGQQYVPGDRSRVLLPLVFCRECGQEYYSVKKRRDSETDRMAFGQRDIGDQLNDGDGESGFLYFSSINPWPDDTEALFARLPDDWLEEARGGMRVKSSRRRDLPHPIVVGPDGRESSDGLRCHYISAPFRLCLNCGVSYDFHQRDDFAKLTSLSSGGRSTATTILSLSAIRNLRHEDSLPIEARKLLSFTDNRQDASLQAGHFNDFVEIGLLRSALARAVAQSGEAGISYEVLTQRVFDTLNLSLSQYASNPLVKYHALTQTQKALRDVLGYRLYRDLKRGWRVTSPNLEQCGLLEIKYLSLDDVCLDEELWQGRHLALVTASPETRMKVAKVLLDFMRRELAIMIDYLSEIKWESIKQQSGQHLISPWAIDENEELQHAAILYPRPQRQQDYGGNVFLSSRGGFGLYIRRPSTFPEYHGHDRIRLDDTEAIIAQLLDALTYAGIIEKVDEPGGPNDVPGFQLKASAMLWTAGDAKTAFHDPIRVPNESSIGGLTNSFFVDFYRNVASDLTGLEAREHTAQVSHEQREEREQKFREGRLPILYCSPTMELGVDIAKLNVVNMRNVPPTPANYAQRSGRAGRSGQPALVFSYCTTGSPHDQFFFKRPHLMVAGAVKPPRLDMANEDLVRAHIHAIWLAETGQSLGKSLKDILDLSGDQPSLELRSDVMEGISSEAAKQHARKRVKHVLAAIEGELAASDWYSDKWLDEVLTQVVLSFDRACKRWRGLYRSALSQAKAQTRIIHDATRSLADKEQASRLRREAEAQLGLLTEVENIVQSDFYSYRYFASEGFLPGYSFPRLPLSAYIPGRRTKQRDEFLSRPRFLAISEFGPRAIVYHEGSRFIINKVILPVEEDEEVLTRRAKVCDKCGYLHPIANGDGLDLCERCHLPLGDPLRQLFRLSNVSTKRRDKINSDEEERMRLGYEIITSVRFAEHGGGPSYRVAAVERDGSTVAKLTYGHTATLWRVNLGWARRKNRTQHGFVLDTERGYWERSEQTADQGQDDPMSAKTARVIPYVEDSRNCLLVEPEQALGGGVMASLQAAIKSAIQVQFQLEDNEIAAEPLPNRENRRLIMLYESAEGGAGVLRRLLDDPQSLAGVAREALRLCHFDPETGEDLRRAPRAKEDCEAACYDCLMSYSNQRDHELLDRQAIRDILLQLAESYVVAAPAGVPRAQHLQMLKNLSGSQLESRWLDYLEEHNLRLPSKAQVLIESCHTRPDFFYEHEAYQAAIYIDGPYHQYPERQERDNAQTQCMKDHGYWVIRFGDEDGWEAKIAQYPHMFGRES